MAAGESCCESDIGDAGYVRTASVSILCRGCANVFQKLIAMALQEVVVGYAGQLALKFRVRCSRRQVRESALVGCPGNCEE